MKMDCSGKRQIKGEVQKEWIESVQEWKSVERKEVEVVKSEERLDEIEVYMTKPTSFEMNGRIIRCSEAHQSWIIDRELKSVWPCLIQYYFSLCNEY